MVIKQIGQKQKQESTPGTYEVFSLRPHL